MRDRPRRRSDMPDHIIAAMASYFGVPRHEQDRRIRDMEGNRLECSLANWILRN
jgi:hypothetical protein